MKKIAVLTSGGDAPGMNAAIRAVARAGFYEGMEVYGIRDGYRGLVENSFVKLSKYSVSRKLNHGGTFLATARFNEFKDDEIIKLAVQNLKSHHIDCLVTIGGDGTYRGAKKLSDFGINVICLPGTIDNDISSTEMTIGFDTARNTVVEAIDKIKDSTNSHNRCSIIEVMGRNCGDLAYHSGIGVGAEGIFTKKENFSYDKVCESVIVGKEEHKRNIIIVITENICNVIDLAEYVEKQTGVETRSTILGYIQRGGIPSAYDRLIASAMGAYAVLLIKDNIYNVGIGTTGVDYYHTPLAKALTMKTEDNDFMVFLEEALK